MLTQIYKESYTKGLLFVRFLPKLNLVGKSLVTIAEYKTSRQTYPAETELFHADRHEKLTTPGLSQITHAYHALRLVVYIYYILIKNIYILINPEDGTNRYSETSAFEHNTPGNNPKEIRLIFQTTAKAGNLD
jgi:hypothetical protein